MEKIKAAEARINGILRGGYYNMETKQFIYHGSVSVGKVITNENNYYELKLINEVKK